MSATSMIQRAALNPEFQAACQRYAHGNGSSHAIAAAALRAVAAPELLAELSAAHEIITVLLNLVPDERKNEMAALLQSAHDGDGAVRYHERRAAISKAKGEQQ